MRAYGRQNLLPPVYAGPVEEWDARLTLNWRLFDGGARKSALALAHSDEQTQQAQIHRLRDTIADQVWTAYSNANTALRRRQAAAALLAASTESYDAAFEAYKLGVRSLLDVVAAQRTLAQARAEDVAGRADVLSQFATLAFRAGDLLHAPPPGTPGQIRGQHHDQGSRFALVVLCSATVSSARVSSARPCCCPFYLHWAAARAPLVQRIRFLLACLDPLCRSRHRAGFLVHLPLRRWHIEQHMRPLVIVYPCIATIFCCTLWLLFFS